MGDESANGTDVHGVARQLVVDGYSWKYIDHRSITSFDDTEFAGTADLIAEAGASCAHDATVSPDGDRWPQFLGMPDVLVLDEAASVWSVRIGVILQDALTSLVANRAIQRVVDQLELHDGVAGIHRYFAFGLDLEAICDSLRTGDHWLGRTIALDHADTAIAGYR